MAIEVFAPAKVNLSLRVTGRRPDGYHLLDSLVVFAGIGDRLVAEPGQGLTLCVSGPLAEGVPRDGRNLVLRAAERLRELRGVAAGARLSLEKHLPHGGGIGGGSSDAAAAITALARMWRVPPLRAEEALALGADLPVCLHAPRPAVMRGIGEVLEPAPALPPAWVVLVNPGVVAPTAAVFAAYRMAQAEDRRAVSPVPDRLDDAARLLGWLREQGNDLTSAAGVMVPEVFEALDGLRAEAGCEHCDMSGSGSTCWGLFLAEDAADAAAKRLAKAHAGWWVRAAPILG